MLYKCTEPTRACQMCLSDYITYTGHGFHPTYTWHFRITHNVVTDNYRSRRQEPNLIEPVGARLMVIQSMTCIFLLYKTIQDLFFGVSVWDANFCVNSIVTIFITIYTSLTSIYIRKKEETISKSCVPLHTSKTETPFARFLFVQ